MSISSTNPFFTTVQELSPLFVPGLKTEELNYINGIFCRPCATWELEELSYLENFCSTVQTILIAYLNKARHVDGDVLTPVQYFLRDFKENQLFIFQFFCQTCRSEVDNAIQDTSLARNAPLIHHMAISKLNDGSILQSLSTESIDILAQSIIPMTGKTFTESILMYQNTPFVKAFKERFNIPEPIPIPQPETIVEPMRNSRKRPSQNPLREDQSPVQRVCRGNVKGFCSAIQNYIQKELPGFEWNTPLELLKIIIQEKCYMLEKRVNGSSNFFGSLILAIDSFEEKKKALEELKVFCDDQLFEFLKKTSECKTGTSLLGIIIYHTGRYAPCLDENLMFFIEFCKQNKDLFFRLWTDYCEVKQTHEVGRPAESTCLYILDRLAIYASKGENNQHVPFYPKTLNVSEGVWREFNALIANSVGE